MNVNDRILTPSTTGNYLVNYGEKIISQYVHLSSYGDPDYWDEITEAEKDALEEEWGGAI